MSDSALATLEAATHEPDQLDGNPKTYRKLSAMDRAYIIKARAQAHPATYDAIAQVIGCHVRTVHRVCESAKLDVVPLLATYADDAVEMLVRAADNAADKGYQQGALAILHYGQKLEPIDTGKGSTTGVNITINAVPLPGTPTYPQALVNITPNEHLSEQRTGQLSPAPIAAELTANAAVAAPTFRPSPSTGESET